jgi:hypothetical protein
MSLVVCDTKKTCWEGISEIKYLLERKKSTKVALRTIQDASVATHKAMVIYLCLPNKKEGMDTTIVQTCSSTRPRG